MLISRAKLRCESFSSITADDIDLERARSRGAAAFKSFLSFAQTGRLPIAEQTGGEEQSQFEEAVAQAVESLGYQVHRQVGIAGFFVDLAVVDSKQPGRYVLGIECDGAAYHHSRSARDRDRLRQAVLEDHGWIIHRIWSTDWFQRPNEQLNKVVEAIERAKTALSEMTTELPSSHFEVISESPDGLEREKIFELDNRGLNGLSETYSEAMFRVSTKLDPHQLYTQEMAAVVLRIVEHEGPIHEEEIVTRVRMLWSKGRAGSRIHDAVSRAIRSLVSSKSCLKQDGFLTMPTATIRVRNRANVTSPTLRKPEHLPPIEIQTAIVSLLEASHGATRSEIPTAVARLFGFQATSPQLKALIESQVARLVKEGKVEEVNGMLKASSAES